MSSIGRISKALLFTTLTLASAPGWASAGKVVISTGDVFAVDSDEQRRTLQRRSDVFEGDTLITGEDSRLQLRFEDNAILALRANSQLRISEYHGASDTEEERVLMDLLGGGFRTISGSFGSDDRDAYQVRTPNASIGIRGTHYEAVYESETLTVGVYEGGVSISNDQGTLNLGLDSDFLYAQVEAGNIPQGLLNPPENLNRPNTPEANEEDGDDSDGDGTEDSDENNNEEDSDLNDAGDQSPDDNPGGSPPPIPDANEISEDDFDFSALEEDLNEELEEDLNEEPENMDEQSSASLLSEQEKQELASNDQTGFVVFSPGAINTNDSSSLNTSIFTYSSIDEESASIIALYPGGSSSEEEGYLYTPISSYDPGSDDPFTVLRPDSDDLLNNTVITLGEETQVQWGQWNLDADDIAEIEAIGNSGLSGDLSKPFYYVLADPINTAELEGESNYFTIATNSGCDGPCLSASNGSVVEAWGGLEANFETGATTGFLGFQSNGPMSETWNLPFAGVVEDAEFIGAVQAIEEGPTPTLSIPGEDINLDNISGSVSGMFTGSDGSVYFVGSFNAQGDGTDHEVYGVFLMEEGAEQGQVEQPLN